MLHSSMVFCLGRYFGSLCASVALEGPFINVYFVTNDKENKKLLCETHFSTTLCIKFTLLIWRSACSWWYNQSA